MIYYIHAYAADRKNVALCCERVRQIDSSAQIIIANDPRSPLQTWEVPAACTVMTPDYPLNGNLNGLECVQGMLHTWRNILRQREALQLVKLDADTWLNRIDWVMQADADYVACERYEPFAPSGCCYMITINAIEAVLRELDGRTWQRGWYYPEDRTVYHLIQLARVPSRLMPYPDGLLAGFGCELPGDRFRHAAVIHCGEPCEGNVPCPRDVVTLRMLMLKDALG